ncbi:cytochrome c oxidase subunit 3 family protein [Paracoccus sp. S-4012]|uniref:cytochrome c oxidase subunit 3 n=1 Tax=Paracoccus sp. S-4012 TaxID=2665648 RepID=UPI0012B10A1A|nr:cytochrome c oxidase subunit 3 [Paracoccus sp. S-4012]MRX49915.1 cytochrome c oxidase subunit 3 family protein [Paracoccus sp. S-4012]
MTRGLHEPFATLPRQREAATFGIWIFLATEMIFFGGLFLGYAVYRHEYPAGFAAAGARTDIVIGTANTMLLLTSSATMAAAVWSGRAGLRGNTLLALVLTALLGTGFLVLKAVEYRNDIDEGLVPGSPAFPLSEPGAELFFGYYWAMTGLHTVHLVIGVGALGLTAWRLWRGRLAWRGTGFLHVLGLYWHFVDVIWIFLFPLLYLMGR